ncbi:MAG: anti-sigma factor, partial [Rhodoferax sp.]|nr:anti-sigma factor [Rhodoferax sp.]
HEPEGAATRAAWQAQRDSLRGLHASLLAEAVPPTLLDAVRRGEKARGQIDQWWRWGGMAAAVLLAFGVGWWSRGIAPQPAAQTLAALSQGNGPGAFARQAVVAHAVYAPEVRHPVEVAAAQQEHLVQWLSKRLGRPLKLPLLTAQGYELVGGRLLPGEPGNAGGSGAAVGVVAGAKTGAARAQFMYQNAAGERITLYLGAVGPASNAAATQATAAQQNMARETAFSFVNDGAVPGFYWVDQGFGYALAGPLPREALLALARTVYQQLEPGEGAK